jgi:hypothetical protein
MKRERNKEEQKERRSTPHLLPIPTYGSSFTFYFSLSTQHSNSSFS